MTSMIRFITTTVSLIAVATIFTACLERPGELDAPDAMETLADGGVRPVTDRGVARADSGFVVDTTTIADSGFVADAATIADVGTSNDSGTPPDAATTLDAPTGPKPTVSAPVPQSAPAYGQPLDLTVTASNYDSLSWEMDHHDGNGFVAQPNTDYLTYRIRGVDNEIGWDYRVRATNAYGSTVGATYTVPKVTPAVAGHIQPYPDNTAYWEYKGKPILLKGSSISNSLVDGRMGAFYFYMSSSSTKNPKYPKGSHVTPAYLGWNPSLDYGDSTTGATNFAQFQNAIREEFRVLSEAGGNFIRLTLADYSPAWTQREESVLYPFPRNYSTGKYDFDAWNTDYWDRLDFVLAEAERREIIVELELWDSWDLRGDDCLWAPKNNDVYGSETGIPDSYSGKREDYPFTKLFVDSNKSVVRKYAEKYIKKVLETCAPYGNILFGVENENPNSVTEWSNNWADFAHANNPYNHPLYITDMRDAYDLMGTAHTAIKNDTARYGYLDASQHSRAMHPENEKYDGYYDDIYQFVNNLGSKKRPVNIAKIYSSYTPPSTWTNQYSMDHGINYYWANIFAGTSGSRYHRPAQNEDFVSPEQARRDHRAATWMVSKAPVWEMTPYHFKAAFTGRDNDGSAYALHNTRTNQYAVYFDKFESEVALKVVAGSYRLQWYDRDTSAAAQSYTVDASSGSAPIKKSQGGVPAGNRAVIVLTRQ